MDNWGSHALAPQSQAVFFFSNWTLVEKRSGVNCMWVLHTTITQNLKACHCQKSEEALIVLWSYYGRVAEVVRSQTQTSRPYDLCRSSSGFRLVCKPSWLTGISHSYKVLHQIEKREGGFPRFCSTSTHTRTITHACNRHQYFSPFRS